MTIDLEKILQLKSNLSKIKLEQIYNYLMATIVVLILCISCFALTRPISVQKYHNVELLSEQHIHPLTQEMAENLKQQRQISLRQYFRLMHAYQKESVRAHRLPDAQEESL